MSKKTIKKEIKKNEHNLVTSIKEMLSHVKGEIKLTSYTYSPPRKIDVAKIRKNLGYSQ